MGADISDEELSALKMQLQELRLAQGTYEIPSINWNFVLDKFEKLTADFVPLMDRHPAEERKRAGTVPPAE